MTEESGFDRRRALLVGTIAAVLISATGVAAWAYIGDVPRGTRVLGVDLGGLARTSAERALHEEFDSRATEPLLVTLAGQTISVAPQEIGMTLNVDRSVGHAMKGSPRVFGSRDSAPVIDLDQGKLTALLRKQVDPKQRTVKAPGIAYSKTTPVPTYPEAGQDVDPVRAAAAVRGAWLGSGTAVVDLSTVTPVTDRAAVDALIRDVATPAVAAPVTVTVGAKQVVLSPAAIAEGLVFRADADGRLAPSLDVTKLHAAAESAFDKVETAPREATVKLEDGKPAIVESKPGDMVDLVALSPALLAVLSRPAPRTVAGSLAEREASVGPAEVAELGIKQKVSTFTTYFTGGVSSPRSQNIMTIAREVDGAIIRPGETFSLNSHTGARDYAAGYQDAPVIVGGKLEPGVGGGASQFTTTLFNAAYYAGLEDVEHKPHSFYFSRYPAVIESTIFYPTLDLKFKNTTPYGILVDTATTSSSVTVTMWSTRYYDSVKTERSPRRNLTSPPTVYRDPGPSCISSSGLPGFTQDAWRIIRKDGREVKREKFTWRYDPEPRFICGAQP